jgi:nicotinate-nucleotide adenylyltransferase
MRLGYFGGSFDPPHRGHLALARAAAVRFALDRVLLVPAARNPIKVDAPHASYIDRLAMVTLLCEADTRLEPSALETPQAHSGDAPSYTIDTLRRLREDLAPTDEIFVLAGADAFLQLSRWRDPDALLAIAEWIVVTRPNFSAEHLQAMALTETQRSRVHVLSELNDPVSATALRARIDRGEDCTGLLPPAVTTYIHEHHLYQT